jgi:hypothetical protein
MTDQNNVIQLLPLHFIGDIKNVGSRLTSGFSRWERSPTPVRVGVNTSCPLWLSSLATRRQTPRAMPRPVDENERGHAFPPSNNVARLH